MKKVNLLLSAPTFYPFYGGAENRFRKYLPKLREYGVHSSVFTGTPKAKKITDEHKKESWYQVDYGEQLPKESYQGIDVARYRLPERPAKKRLGVYHQKLREYLSEQHKNIDVIQFLSPFSMSAIETLKFAKKKKIATVMACTLAKTPNPNILRRIIDNRRTRKIYSSCNCVVVSSNEMKEYLLDFGIKNRIEVIGNGVDTNLYRPAKTLQEKNDIRKKLGIPLDRKILLNVGTVHPRKGTDLLLGAFKLIASERTDIDLYIAGSRADRTDSNIGEFRDNLQCLISDPTIEGRVHFLGLIENVNEYMQVADIFVFPSREEGMGNVVMEAMASKLPVIVTPYLGFPSVFGCGQNYVMTEFDSGDIAKNIIGLSDDFYLRERISSSAYKNVVDNLNINNSIRVYSDLYHGKF